MPGMLDKCQQYHAWGVPVCWVIDPVEQRALQSRIGSPPQRVTGLLLNELFSA
ncbi:MAG: Uma2 family endonuclease [Bryobacteraceae bacterium]|nr:Uma2 family endonuclease [Bryobacteraceae bacterium]